MKYIVIVCDGLSERLVEVPDGDTPLSAAVTPGLDMLAKKGQTGLVKLSDSLSYPEAMRGNMTVLGYRPKSTWGAVTIFEAVSSGIPFEKDDVVFRCTPVQLSDEEQFGERDVLSVWTDIDNEAAKRLTEIMNENVGNDIFHFYCAENNGVFLVWKKGEPEPGILYPPSVICGEKVSECLPKGDFTPVLTSIIRKSAELLRKEPVHTQDGSEVSALWLWGEGVIPDIVSFSEKYGLTASMISPYPVMEGMGMLMGIKAIPASADVGTVMSCLDDSDLLYVHIPDPIFCGRNCDAEEKAECIEAIDSKFIRPLIDSLERSDHDEYTIAVISSVSTSCITGENTAEPVPYMIYRSTAPVNSGFSCFSEQNAFDSGIYVPYECDIIDSIINAEKNSAPV